MISKQSTEVTSRSSEAGIPGRKLEAIRAEKDFPWTDTESSVAHLLRTEPAREFLKILIFKGGSKGTGEDICSIFAVFVENWPNKMVLGVRFFCFWLGTIGAAEFFSKFSKDLLLMVSLGDFTDFQG